MNRILITLGLLVVTAVIVANIYTRTAIAQPQSHAALIDIDSAIHPVVGRFLGRGLDQAVKDGAQFVIIQLDTPGGLLSTTRAIVADILASPIPVIVYVTPSGAHAASAGTFILASAHVAVMSPATNIGAATPIEVSGGDLPETMKSKATEDAAAFLRSISRERSRNADALQRTVTHAASYTETEALEIGIIDFVASDIAELISKLDPIHLEGLGIEAQLDTGNIAIHPITPNALEKFLGIIADPQITFILLSVGGILIILELLNPGIMFPGAFGVIALAIAFLGLGNLPANWVGVGLIILGLVFLYIELAAPGLGVFGVTGGVSFFLGAFFMFYSFGTPAIPTPALKVSIWAIAIVGAIICTFTAMLYISVRQSKQTHYRSTTLTLVGDVGFTKTALQPRGTVQVGNEVWSALSDLGVTIAEGEEVIVSEVVGLTLKVIKKTDIES